MIFDVNKIVEICIIVGSVTIVTTLALSYLIVRLIEKLNKNDNQSRK